MTHITFHPAWLLLVPVIAFLAWRCPRLGLLRPARALAVLALVLLLCDPGFPSRRGGMDLWVLLDRSVSTADITDRQSAEWRTLLEDARPSYRDRIHYIDFAEDALPAIDGGGTELAPARRGQTRTAQAINFILARQDATRPTRVLAFTDGYATEPLGETAARLAAEGIPLDYRLIQPPGGEDYRLTGIDAPTRVQSGEAFLLRARVAGSGGKPDAEVPIVLLRDGETIAESTMRLRDGVGSIEWADRLTSGGSRHYEIAIRPPTDAHPGNNRASTWVETTSGPRILVISRHPDDPLAAAFSSQGLETDLLTEPSQATSARLAGARAVVLHNVPSHDFAPGFLDSLDFFVRQQGGGLLMIGGRHSFGSGGFFQSPIDELLPVSMELKADQRKLALAMAVVLDRSGSMMASADGPPGTTKMDLANAGTAAAIELLGAQDSVAVFAVDSSPHTVVPLVNVGSNRGKIIGRVRSIQSSGGGIYVYQGLRAAWAELQKATAGTRHLILFADANDAEEPGKYIELIREMTDAGVTISVVGLGTDKDSDSAFLIDIARRGNGRIHFTEDANEIPRIFAGETVAVARSAFINQPTGLAPTGEWSEISSLPIEWPPAVDGYNLSYSRPGATVAALSTDEYAAPLVAAIRRGLGRSAAISFPMAGESSAQVRTWPGFNGFSRTLGRWLIGDPVPPGIGLIHRIDGTRLTLDLHYDSARWGREIATTPPKLLVRGGRENPEPSEISWARLAPGHFSAAFDLRENDQLRGVVQIGNHTLPFGPLAVPLSAEWAFDPARLADLRLASRRTGGVERTDLSTAWDRPPVLQHADLRLPLALLALLLILFDAFTTKTGFRFPLPALPRLPDRAPRLKRPKPSPAAQPAATSSPPAQTEPPPPTGPDEAQRRRERFLQAKKNRDS
jgi:uncharacterized membrane protein